MTTQLAKTPHSQSEPLPTGDLIERHSGLWTPVFQTVCFIHDDARPMEIIKFLNIAHDQLERCEHWNAPY
jgi:hypothetical protein